MKRKRLLSFLSVVLLFALGCSLAPLAPPTPVRTAVPTWTLPFHLETPGQPLATDTPGAISAPTNTLVVQTEGPPATASPTARPGIDPTLGVTTPDPYATLWTPVPEPMPQMHLDKDI